MKRIIITLLSALIYLSVNAQYRDWAQFGRYSKANAEVSVKPLAVFMGDSITDNWQRADADFFSAHNIAGRGISGQTTSEMLVRFRRDVIDLKPKYVVILAGTNDIAKNNGEIALENVLGNIQSMCELAKAHKIKPILCSVLPADRYSWRKEMKPAEDIIRLNQMIKEYAKSQRIPYVDYHSVLKNENNGMPENYAADGVHPNLDCYKIMEEIVLRYL